MSHKIDVQEEAEQDMQEAFEWYEAKQEGQGERFLDKVEETFDQISEAPEMFAVQEHGHRSVKVRKFPYLVLYAIVSPVVKILRVFHTSRDPSSI